MYLFTLSSDEKTFVFEFPWIEISSRSSCISVKCVLYRKDVADVKWEWKGRLTTQSNIKYHLEYIDSININGTFTLFQNENQDYIFFNAHYGYQFGEHFEGNGLLIGQEAEQGIIPIPPPPPPTDDDSPFGYPEQPSGKITPVFNNLFPYLYLQELSPETPYDQKYFIAYPKYQSSPPVDDYYNQLVLLCKEYREGKRPSARLDIIDATHAFQVSPDYIAGFNQIPEQYRLFPLLYDQILAWKSIKEPHFKTAIFEPVSLNEEKLPDFLNDSAHLGTMQQIWLNIFSDTIILSKSLQLYNDLNKIIVVNNLLTRLDDIHVQDVKAYIKASVLLPNEIFPLPPFNFQPDFGYAPYSGTIIPYAIGNLHMVQYSLSHYSVGDIAHIENVLKGEVKEVRKSNATTTEERFDTSEQVTNVSEEHITDEIKELEQILSNTTQKKKSTEDDYTNLETSYGPPTVATYNGKVTDTINGSSDVSQNATEYAKNIVSNSVQRLSKKIKTFRSNVTQRISEESTIHTFDNRNGSTHIRGIYRWMDKVYKARLINYGHRFMIELLIKKPEISYTGNTNEQFTDLKDLTPPIISFQDITRDNYLQLASLYEIGEIPLPPEPCKKTTTLIESDKLLASGSIEIPDGYVPCKIMLTYIVTCPVKIMAGNEIFQTLDNEGTHGITFSTNDRTQYSSGELPVAIMQKNRNQLSPPLSDQFFVTAELSSVPSTETMNKWKISVYHALKEACKQIKTTKAELSLNNNVNTEISHASVKQAVITASKELLLENHICLNGLQANSQISPPPGYVNIPEYTAFIDKAFEWDEITYTLHDSFKSGSTAKIKQDINQQLQRNEVQTFMEAEHLRVLLPVNPEFNNRVLYYLGTGQIFSGEDLLSPILNNDKDKYTASFLRSVYNPYCIEKELSAWHITVPTQLQWLQGNNVVPFKNDDRKNEP